MSRCLDGESGAYEALTQAYSPVVTATIAATLRKYNFSVSTGDVEDLHNSLFLALMEDDFRRLRRYAGRASLRSYLRVIAVRHVVDFLRRQKTTVSLDAELSVPSCEDPGATPDRVLEAAQLQALLRGVIADLPAHERLLLKLVYDRELPPEQVCAVLGLSPTAYYNRKSRLLRKIQKLCEEFPSAASQ